MKRVFSWLTEVHAHCDVPCGVYDPSEAQIAAHSVARFLQQIDELTHDSALSVSETGTLIRMVQQKEEHAAAVKHAIGVIWGDYFKPDHFEAHPGLHQLTHDIMRAASVCKQEFGFDNGTKLVELVNQFAEIFWQTREIETTTVTAPYQPHLPRLVPILPSVN